MGVTARSFTAACCTPMTVVKTRFESGRFQYRSVVDALTNIATTEGPKGDCSLPLSLSLSLSLFTHTRSLHMPGPHSRVQFPDYHSPICV
jgi:hypothetical protein